MADISLEWNVFTRWAGKQLAERLAKAEAAARPLASRYASQAEIVRWIAIERAARESLELSSVSGDKTLKAALAEPPEESEGKK